MKGIFHRENVKKEVIIDQIRDDPQPRRIVIASFSKIEAIQRQATGFDSKRKRILIQVSSYKVYRGSVKSKRNFVQTRLKEIFHRKNVKKKVIIDQIRDDPQSRRIVIASFSKVGGIQRQATGFDSKRKRILVQDSPYKIYQGSVKSKEISYKQDWKEPSEKEEDRRVFNTLVEKGWTKGWG